jgi:glyoxylase I family protein
MKLEHVALNLSDPQGAAAWYAEQLGLHLVKANSEAPFEHFLSDEGGSLLEFYTNPAGDLPDYAAMSPFTLHLAFAAHDLEAAYEKLLAAGATAAGDITQTPAGDRLVFLRDPWGVALQLVQRRTPLL